MRRRTASGGVWELAVGTDGAVELTAGDVLEAADGTAVCALLVCPGRLPDTAAEQTDLSVAEKLAVCVSLCLHALLCTCLTLQCTQEAEKFNGELQRKVLELEQRLAKQKKRLCRTVFWSLCVAVSPPRLGVPIPTHTEMQKEQQKHEDEDYVDAPKRKRGRAAAS